MVIVSVLVGPPAQADYFTCWLVGRTCLDDVKRMVDVLDPLRVEMHANCERPRFVYERRTPPMRSRRTRAA